MNEEQQRGENEGDENSEGGDGSQQPDIPANGNNDNEGSEHHENEGENNNIILANPNNNQNDLHEPDSHHDEEGGNNVANNANNNNEDDEFSILTIPLVDALLREGLNWEGGSNSSIESDESDIGEGTSGEREDDVVANLNNGDDSSDAEGGGGAEMRLRYLEFLLGRPVDVGLDSSDDEGDENHGNDENEVGEESNEPLRPARDHAYLPTAQPLYPEEWIPAGRHRMKQQRLDSSGISASDGGMETNEAEEGKIPEDEDNIAENAMETGESTAANHFRTNVEDDSIHSFPHYYIPEPPDPLSHQFGTSTSFNSGNSAHAQIPQNQNNMPEDVAMMQSPSSTQTTLALLEIDDVILFPGATLPLRLRDPRWLEYLVPLIDDARGLFGAHPMGEVRIGILPRIENGVRRTPRAPRESGGRTGRWRIDLIRRGITRRRPRMGLLGQGGARNQTRSEDGNARNERQDALAAAGPGEGDDTQQRRQVRTFGASQEGENARADDGEHSDDESEDDYFHPTTPAVNSDDPYVGRVGTMATITFTHEEAVPSSFDGTESGAVSVNNNEGNRPPSMLWQRHRGELVVTALGTNRFRVVKSSAKNRSQKRQTGSYGNATLNNIPLYSVDVWGDGNSAFPPPWIVQLPGNGRCPVIPCCIEEYDKKPASKDNNKTNDSNENTHVSGSNAVNLQHNNIIRNLSLRSSTPAVAYRALWPWLIGDKICSLIKMTDQLQGLLHILPSAPGVVSFGEEESLATIDAATKRDTIFHVVDPSAFANWLGCNMPLGINDRLDLLEMPTATQQLRYISRKIQKQRETMLRCKYCAAAISQIRNVFTVGGAEGTTGAYVNEYGVVHQTVTLRTVDNQSVICTGRPETKDSWFPGYAWTVTNCALCYSHLGWKFTKVKGKRRAETSISGEEEEGPDRSRPEMFWGLSAITTEENVAPRRVFRTTRGL